MIVRIGVLVSGILLLVTATAAGKDLFQVHVTTSTGEPMDRVVGGSSLVNLARNVVEQRGEFAEFEGRDIFARIRYAGVPDAIQFSVNAEGTEATLSIPRTGLVRTFSAAEGDLDGQIRDFLLEEGASEYAAFLREMNRASPVAVTDGNPRATTAFQAEQVFNRYAFHSGWNLSHPDARHRRGFHSRFDLEAGRFRTDVADGTWIAGGLSSSIRFSQRVSVATAIPVQYRDIEGAQVYDIGGELALPIRIHTGRNGRVGWQLTPVGLISGSFSQDMAAGGVMWGAGVSSSIMYRIDDNLSLVMGNQVTFHEGTRLRFRDYRLETDVSQQVLKNGVKAVYNLRGFYVDAGLIHTLFLQEAAVGDFWSPVAGVGLRFGDVSGVRLGYTGDFKGDYRSHSGQLMLYFGW